MGGKRLTVISLFTGAMGLDLGFEAEGFEVRVAVDNDAWARETIKANRPGLEVIPRNLADVPTAELVEKAGLEPGEATVIAGASPCEPFSTAGRRQSMQDSRGGAVYDFIRVVKEARPPFFVFEQVPGFLRAAKRHISFYERIAKRQDDLHPDERLGSAFEEVMLAFAGSGYALSFDPDRPGLSVLNAADFGAPQKRMRFILIGARDGPAVVLPEPTHRPRESLEAVAGLLRPWVTFREAVRNLDDPTPEHLQFPTTWGPLLEYVPPGGCWRDLPPELHREALGGAYDEEKTGKKGGRTGFLRRLAWDKAAPTVVDRPTTRAGCLCHPAELRPLSVAEYRRLQGFPDDWVVKGPVAAKYRLIGQATPVPLARAVARAVLARARQEDAVAV